MVDGRSLAVVRIALGVVGLLSAVRLLTYDWVESLLVAPRYRFTYPGLWWVPRPSLTVALALVVVLGLSSIAVAAGWRTRPALAVFVITFVWIEAIDATIYLNHYWFVTLLGLLLLAAPSGSALSVDSRGRGGPIPVDGVWVVMVRVQVAVVYMFAAVAKIHPDWLLHALPLRLWLPESAGVPVVGPFLGLPLTAHLLSVAGFAFDLTVVAFLLWRRTRLVAWLVLVVFHVVTWLLFPIGVFPWLMIGVSTVFFAPDWPQRLGIGRRPSAHTVAGRQGPVPSLSRPALVGVVVWVLFQFVVPLRHHLVGGDARWTGEAYRFSWNVLATERSGDLAFRVTDPDSGSTELVDPAELLTANQIRVVATEPEMIRQLAHMIAAERGGAAEVRADVWVSLNGREPARLVDPAVDLAAEPSRLGHQPWILPAPATPPP